MVFDYAAAFLLILALTFILPRMMPGDPLQAIYGDEAMIAMSPEMKADLTRRFSLDQPPGRQFLSYMASLARGDLGYSYYYQEPVMKVVLGSLPWTVLLTGLALALSTLLGLILGVESGYRRGQPVDRALLTGIVSLGGLPDFFIGILFLLFFGITLGIAPLAGAITPYSGHRGLPALLDVLHHLALPLAALVLVRITGAYLLARNTMVSTLGEPFIMTARAKGCHEPAVKYRHAGKNSLLPVVTAAGLQLAHLFSGALFIEIVFSYPGMGSLLYNALLARDYPLIQGILLLVTMMVLAVNLAVDILYKKIDPRVFYAH